MPVGVYRDKGGDGTTGPARRRLGDEEIPVIPPVKTPVEASRIYEEHVARFAASKFGPADKALMEFGRGLNNLVSAMEEGNVGLKMASRLKVLLSYELGGYYPRARVGAHVDVELNGLTVARVRELLTQAVAEVQGTGMGIHGALGRLIREDIQTSIHEWEFTRGAVEARIMDATDLHAPGTSYYSDPKKVASRAKTAAAIRDKFIEKVEDAGATVREKEEV